MNDWTPVSQALPKQWQLVLAYQPGYGDYGFALACIGTNGRLTTADGFAPDFTHWMPLPEPPTVDEVNEAEWGWSRRRAQIREMARKYASDEE